jgi:hypothetical protein
MGTALLPVAGSDVKPSWSWRVVKPNLRGEGMAGTFFQNYLNREAREGR